MSTMTKSARPSKEEEHRHSSSSSWRRSFVFLVVGGMFLSSMGMLNRGLLAVSDEMKLRLSDGTASDDEDASEDEVHRNYDIDALSKRELVDCQNSNNNNNTHGVVKTEEIGSSPPPPPPTTTTELKTSSCTEHIAYPAPDHHTGLPYLTDVFATRDKQFVVFVTMNRGVCQPEWKDNDQFFDYNTRFICMFQGNIPVISEFVAPNGKLWKYNALFKCAIPKELQHLVIPDQSTTNLHLDLHSILDPEVKPMGYNKVKFFPSQKLTDTHKLSDLAVCHAGYGNKKEPYEMVMYTRAKSGYSTKQAAGESSTVYRILEWIDWHRSQGFDHFVIYDNDDEPHGPIEELLKPLVESGLVTYRWFPGMNCQMGPGSKFKGENRALGQAAGGISALHRIGHDGMKYLGHADIDEFFVAYNNKTVLEYVHKMLNYSAPSDDGRNLDLLQFRPTVPGACNGTLVQSAGDSPLETRQCWTHTHKSDVKLIMRADRIINFMIHYPVTSRNWGHATGYKVDDEREGFLAHYRGTLTPGVQTTKYFKRIPYFDDFLAERRRNKNIDGTTNGNNNNMPS